MDFSEKLRGFEDVWRRVEKSKSSSRRAQPQTGRAAQSRSLPPCRKNSSRASRFNPGRR